MIESRKKVARKDFILRNFRVWCNDCKSDLQWSQSTLNSKKIIVQPCQNCKPKQLIDLETAKKLLFASSPVNLPEDDDELDEEEPKIPVLPETLDRHSYNKLKYIAQKYNVTIITAEQFVIDSK